MPLTQNENKVKFGLKRVAFALATIAEDGSATYGTPITFPGARSLSMEPQGTGEPWYADDGVYYYSSAPASRQGDLEMARMIDAFKRLVLGYILDANGVQLEDMNPAEVHFALLFETMNDKKPRRYVMYNCVATAPTVGSTTNEGSKEPQTETSSIMSTSIYVASHDKWFDHAETTPRTDPEAYANWFNAVQLPGAPADPNPVKTKSGAVVSITDGAEDMAVEGLSVAIDTETGVTGATITRSGKNLLNANNAVTGTSNGITYTVNKNSAGAVTDVQISGTASALSTRFLIPLSANWRLPAGDYILSKCTEDYLDYRLFVNCMDGSNYVKQFLAGNSVKQVSFTLDYVGYDHIAVGLVVGNGKTMDVTCYPAIFRAAETDRRFEPYQGEAYAFDWTASPGAITEGTLDAVAGKLTTGGETYNLTPAEITTLHGDNIIYADCGPVTVEYHSDPNLDFE